MTKNNPAVAGQILINKQRNKSQTFSNLNIAVWNLFVVCYLLFGI